MKAKLRAGKQGAKGRVKKYADGGMTMGKIAPPGIAAMAAGAPAPMGPRGFGPTDGGVRPPSVMQAGLAPMGPRGFGPTDGGPSPGMGPKDYGMGRPGMGRHDMGHHRGMGNPGPRGFGPNDGGPRPGMGRPGVVQPGPRGFGPTENMPRPLTGTDMATMGAAPVTRSLAAMGPGSTVMPEGRAFKKGGMVGCDWKAPSSKTMRGAARKG